VARENKKWQLHPNRRKCCLCVIVSTDVSADPQENIEVRAAAFALFGDLAAFGSGASKEQFLEQIHTNFVSFLLHLNDHENPVRQVQN